VDDLEEGASDRVNVGGGGRKLGVLCWQLPAVPRGPDAVKRKTQVEMLLLGLNTTKN